MLGTVPAPVGAGMAVSIATAGERLGSRTSYRSLLLHETALQPWTYFLKADAEFLHSTKPLSTDSALENAAQCQLRRRGTRHSDLRFQSRTAPALQTARLLRTLRKPRPAPAVPASAPAFPPTAAPSCS